MVVLIVSVQPFVIIYPLVLKPVDYILFGGESKEKGGV
jgi:hypothetical protein